jgi:hypothetical protein
MSDEFRQKHSGKYWYYVASTVFGNAAAAWPANDAKSAARFVHDAVARGWHVNMQSYESGIVIADAVANDDRSWEPVAYVAELKCGCVTSMHVFDEDSDEAQKTAAKILKMWVEQNAYIYTRPIDEIVVHPKCPHEAQMNMVDELRRAVGDMPVDGVGVLVGGSAELAMASVAGLLPSGGGDDVVDGEFEAA